MLCFCHYTFLGHLFTTHMFLRRDIKEAGFICEVYFASKKKKNLFCRCDSVPVFAVRLQTRDKVTSPRLHDHGLVVHGDDVGGDLCTVTVWLVPLQE